MLDKTQDHSAKTHWLQRSQVATNNWLLVLARILIAALFLPGGFNKLTHLDAFATSLAGRGIPADIAYPLSMVGAGVEFFAPLALLLGFQLRIMTLLLIVFTIVATLISHRFWDFQDAARSTQLIQFNKNIAIIGGLLALFVAGPGRYSVDGDGRQ
jgi:putative oxidoreductase